MSNKEDGKEESGQAELGLVAKDRPLSCLYLEDNVRDRQLVVEFLREDGLACEITHAKTGQEFQAAIIKTKFDVIISDFTLPAYSGMTALAAARDAQPDTPFLFVSGTIGEERAVESLKSGATDYVLKGNLDRLGFAVRRAMGEARERERRRQAEDSLKESEARFRQLAENINEAFWLFDVERNELLYVSPAYEKIWGRSPKSLLADPSSRLNAVHDDDRTRLTATLTAHELYDETYRIIRPDGTIRWIHERAYPVKDEAGTVRRMAGTVQDITERQLLEERCHQSQKMEAIGQLAGGVAHDFNNLLQVMRGCAELVLMDSERLEPMNCENLKQIVDATQRAANLTRQLLTFSRKQAIQPETLSLNLVVKNLVKMLRRVIGEDIELQCDYTSQPLGIYADSGMLEQVLMNLVVNARDAMPDGGRLAIRTSRIAFSEETAKAHAEARPGDFMCLSVGDTGSGIAAEHLPRIFEPFFTTKGLGKGTGLGLATVYGIVKQHRGWIEVVNRPGAGATFNVFLPATNTDAPTAEGSADEAMPQGGSETILLVEDDPAVRLLTRRTLEAFGYRVWEAASGREALRIWRAGALEINLLLTDLVMPSGVPGGELARMLHQQSPKLKIIFMSGYSPELASEHDPRVSPGTTVFLQKPFRSSVLIETVRRSLDET